MLQLLANFFVGFSAFEHLYFMVLEMFLWTTPRACKAFGMTPEFAKSTAAIAANQGLYNGFLATGLIWSLISRDAMMSMGLKIFFLGFIVVAGIYGGKTVNKKIFFVQSIPAAIGIIFVVLSYSN